MKEIGFLLLSFLFWADAGAAYTLWSATGEASAGGGTLIAKNRDWNPASVNRVELRTPKAGRRYIGLFADGALKGGVNEEGLAVFSASASGLRPGEKTGRTRGALARMLETCGSVDEVLARKNDIFGSRPVFYLVADCTCSAWIEIAPGGAVTVRRTANGGLAHTNHYLAGENAGFNHAIGASSAARLARIGELLASKSPLSFDDFVAFSEDRSGGPDNGIWREGSPGARERTVASVVAELPPSGPPKLYVKIANRGETPETYRLVLDARLKYFDPRSAP